MRMMMMITLMMNMHNGRAGGAIPITAVGICSGAKKNVVSSAVVLVVDCCCDWFCFWWWWWWWMVPYSCHGDIIIFIMGRKIHVVICSVNEFEIFHHGPSHENQHHDYDTGNKRPGTDCTTAATLLIHHCDGHFF